MKKGIIKETKLNEFLLFAYKKIQLQAQLSEMWMFSL